MVHLNKNQLAKTQLDDLFSQLSATLGKLSASEAENFLSELLGFEERVMIAKRLSCIILIQRGISSHKASRLLKLSPSTAEKIKEQLHKGAYASVTQSLEKNKKSYLAILKSIDEILHLGGLLPHYNGLDRYKFRNK
jgi:uncharacterized protein YerC